MHNVKRLIERLYEADPEGLDRFVRTKGEADRNALEVLLGLEWFESHQGGGCLALAAALPWGGEALITEEEGVDIPEDDEPAFLGFYDEDFVQEAEFRAP
ncbi:hypothetical protein [Deinococcus sp. S9]|uniref:hypothetical protein n=1 Tax=Deinococcus sp. S9 TaxID=2545754 RepID=UPI00105555A4|nr:hypothetical protein [Deinococcus sp. S9]TDE87376.1 hypothetical protein E0686_02465 [Deinococcus sp. S9]